MKIIKLARVKPCKLTVAPSIVPNKFIPIGTTLYNMSSSVTLPGHKLKCVTNCDNHE